MKHLKYHLPPKKPGYYLYSLGLKGLGPQRMPSNYEKSYGADVLTTTSRSGLASSHIPSPAKDQAGEQYSKMVTEGSPTNLLSNDEEIELYMLLKCKLYSKTHIF